MFLEHISFIYCFTKHGQISLMLFDCVQLFLAAKGISICQHVSRSVNNCEVTPSPSLTTPPKQNIFILLFFNMELSNEHKMLCFVEKQMGEVFGVG